MHAGCGGNAPVQFACVCTSVTWFGGPSNACCPDNQHHSPSSVTSYSKSWWTASWGAYQAWDSQSLAQTNRIWGPCVFFLFLCRYAHDMFSKIMYVTTPFVLIYSFDFPLLAVSFWSSRFFRFISFLEAHVSDTTLKCSIYYLMFFMFISVWLQVGAKIVVIYLKQNFNSDIWNYADSD